MEDSFEQKVTSLLNKRLEEAKYKLEQNNLIKNDLYEENIDDSNIEERLPYSIAKTVQYIKQEEYIRKTKSLKNTKL